MFLKKKFSAESNAGSILVEIGVIGALFLVRLFDRPIKRDLTFFIKVFTFLFVLISLTFLVRTLLIINHPQVLSFVLIVGISVWFIRSSSGYFPLWVDNQIIMTLWRQDNQFLKSMDFGESTDIATPETQAILLEELRLYVDNPLEKQQEILALCNKKLIFSELESGARRYTVLPKESRYLSPESGEIYWLTKSTLEFVKKNPSLLFKYLRVPSKKDTQHFQVFEIIVKEGSSPIVFEGEIEHGDRHWQESAYADLLDYQHEMFVSIVIDRNQWTVPKRVAEFYIGI